MNPRPLPPQGSALPICATPRQRYILYYTDSDLSSVFSKKIIFFQKNPERSIFRERSGCFCFIYCRVSLLFYIALLNSDIIASADGLVDLISIVAVLGIVEDIYRAAGSSVGSRHSAAPYSFNFGVDHCRLC